MSVVLHEASTVELVTIPNVELLSVGDWNASTGPVTFSEDDLKAAIAALDDPAIKSPRLRIGHTPPNITPEESAGGFEEQPAFGKFTNLRLSNNGTTIVADAVGVPAWLAQILPAAFPSRSVEAYFNVTTAAGRTHGMVITSVALLGVSMPACETLEDLRLAFGAETPDGVELQFTGERVAASQGEAMPKRVSASVTYSDVRTSFYNEFATQDTGRYWWWICDFIMSPATVIADDDEGGLWSVPYSLNGDSIAWGEPVEVRVQYVETESGKVAAQAPDVDHRTEYFAAGVALAAAPTDPLFTAASSRPTDRVRAASPTKGAAMNDEQRKALAAKLELPADSTEEQITDKLQSDAVAALEDTDDTAETEPTAAAPAPVPVAAAANDKTVTVDTDRFSQMEEDARLGREARLSQVGMSADKLVDDAVADGRITPASRASWRTAILPDKATELFKPEVDQLAQLAKGRVPVQKLSTSAPDAGSEQARKAKVAAALGIRKENR